jgi:type I restriction enzyme M protein
MKLGSVKGSFVDHDLHNHNGEMPDGIAEAFIHWAKKEKLSFWKGG